MGFEPRLCGCEQPGECLRVQFLSLGAKKPADERNGNRKTRRPFDLRPARGCRECQARYLMANRQ